MKVMVSAENEISSSNFEKRFNALIAYMKSIRLMKTLWEQFNMQIQFWERQMEVIFNTNECHISNVDIRKNADFSCFTSQCDGTVVILGVQCCSIKRNIHYSTLSLSTIAFSEENASLTFMLETGLIFSTLVTSPVWEECKGNDCESALPGTTDSRAIFSLLTAFHDAVGKLKSTLLDLGALTTLRKHIV
ncbi:hypothetical protein T01_2040 [Trichinella spiralis]|uniref:Uncharacterized protein n=1 Tax=Trichinella spiralis TaxID=6334 RepID=A0A0V1BQD3_TRISP|nr:hypothetical protein T01_2040 [Trichinella spiralis]